jgi:hypothetical protein
MASTVVNDINKMFTSRLTRPDKLVGRPINPFATTSSHDNKSTFFENMLKPEVTSTTKLGAVYQGQVVDTKFEDAVRFDVYAVQQNPRAGLKLHATGRMKVEHTREK